MKLFITGATGFVGLNLVEQLQSEDFDVTVLVRPDSPTERLPENVSLVTGDIKHPDTYDEELTDIDTIVHLAATSNVTLGERFVRETNFVGSKKLFSSAERQGVNQIVFTSTIWAHKECRENPTIGQSNPYVQSKIDVEDYLLNENYSFDFSIIYPTHVMGPNDYQLNRYSMFYRVAANRILMPPLYIPGRWNIVHVNDVISSIIECFDDTSIQRRIASGDTVSSKTLCKLISEIGDFSCTIIPISSFVHSKILLPSIVKAGKLNIIADREYEQLDSQAHVAVPPESLEGNTDSDLATVIEDSIDWYKSVGLL